MKIGISGMLAFVVAEMILTSGIVSVLFCGIVMSRYVEMNVGCKNYIMISISPFMKINFFILLLF